MTAKDNIDTKRKLNERLRTKIANFAMTKFLNVELRAKETAQKALIVELFKAFHKREIAPYLETLSRFSITGSTTRLELPRSLQLRAEDKVFEVDGKQVVRENWDKFDAPTSMEPFGGFVAFRDAKNTAYRGSGSSDFRYYGGNDRYIELGDKYWVPVRGQAGNNDWDILGETAKDDNGRSDGSGARHAERLWLDPKIFVAIQDLYRISADRANSEYKLWAVAIKMIHVAQTMADIKTFFPEVKEIENSLFEVKEEPFFAMVAVSADDRAALCANMGARGVAATICAV